MKSVTRICGEAQRLLTLDAFLALGFEQIREVGNDLFIGIDQGSPLFLAVDDQIAHLDEFALHLAALRFERGHALLGRA